MVVAEISLRWCEQNSTYLGNYTSLSHPYTYGSLQKYSLVTQRSRLPHVSHSSLLQFCVLVYITQSVMGRKACILGPCIFAGRTCHTSSVRWIRTVWRIILPNLVPAYSTRVPKILPLIAMTGILEILTSRVPSTRTSNYPLLFQCIYTTSMNTGWALMCLPSSFCHVMNYSVISDPDPFPVIGWIQLVFFGIFQSRMTLRWWSE